MHVYCLIENQTIFSWKRREETLGQSLTEEEILQYCEKLPKYKRPRKL